MAKLGFIGAGNMAEAMVRGLLSSADFGKRDIVLHDVDERRLSDLRSRYGVLVASDANELVKDSDVVVFSVKPGVIPDVCREIRNVASTKKLYVSVAAGVPRSFILGVLGDGKKLARVMPNAPCLVLRGASCVCFGEGFSAEEEALVLRMFGSLGKVWRVENEDLMDAVTGLSGSGPAFVAMFVEALSDGGVKAGLRRELATELAAQTVLGTSEMIMESGKHPAEIKDMVASPGGTTISGIHSLESRGFRGAVISAVEAAAKRSARLSGQED